MSLVLYYINCFISQKWHASFQDPMQLGKWCKYFGTNPKHQESNACQLCQNVRFHLTPWFTRSTRTSGKLQDHSVPFPSCKAEGSSLVSGDLSILSGVNTLAAKRSKNRWGDRQKTHVLRAGDPCINLAGSFSIVTVSDLAPSFGC